MTQNVLLAAYRQLARYLIESDGDAPPLGAAGLWVDLYDEIKAGLDAEDRR